MSRGSPQLTDRDTAAVQVLCEQQAIRQDDYGRVLGWLGTNGPLVPRVVRRQVERQLALGLVERHRFLADQPAFLVPTRVGAELVGWTGPIAPPKVTQLRHTLTCAAVAQLYRESGAGWVSDRVLARAASFAYVGDRPQRVATAMRRPDGVASWTDGRAAGGPLDGMQTQQVAVEVELTIKTKARTATILRSLAAQFPAIHFWVDSAATAKHIASVADAELVAAKRKSLTIKRLGDTAR